MERRIQAACFEMDFLHRLRIGTTATDMTTKACPGYTSATTSNETVLLAAKYLLVQIFAGGSVWSTKPMDGWFKKRKWKACTKVKTNIFLRACTELIAGDYTTSKVPSWTWPYGVNWGFSQQTNNAFCFLCWPIDVYVLVYAAGVWTRLLQCLYSQRLKDPSMLFHDVELLVSGACDSVDMAWLVGVLGDLGRLPGRWPASSSAQGPSNLIVISLHDEVCP